MAGTVIDVETDDFVVAASAASSAAASVRAARDAARASLAGLSRMAGSDPSGVTWASSYDGAAKDAFTGLDGLVLALEQVSAGLAVTGLNYATADWLSAGHAGQAPGTTAPSTPVAERTSPPPTASGGSRSFGAAGFDLVANFIGDLWPDGDTGKLKSAGAAWKALGSDLDSAVSGCTRILDALSSSQTPEMDSIRSTVTTVQGHVSDLASQAGVLGGACVSFASHIDQVHTDTERELQSLLLQVELTAAGGLVLTFVTAGLSDAAAAAGAAAEVAASVSRILAFIARLASAALKIADEAVAAGSSFVKAASLSEKIGVKVAVFAGKSAKYGLGGAAGNVAVTAIVDPKANLADAAVSGFVGGAAFGMLGEGAVIGVRAVSSRVAARAAGRFAADMPVNRALVDSADSGLAPEHGLVPGPGKELGSEVRGEPALTAEGVVITPRADVARSLDDPPVLGSSEGGPGVWKHVSRSPRGRPDQIHATGVELTPDGETMEYVISGGPGRRDVEIDGFHWRGDPPLSVYQEVKGNYDILYMPFKPADAVELEIGQWVEQAQRQARVIPEGSIKEWILTRNPELIEPLQDAFEEAGLGDIRVLYVPLAP
ncbi:WXG100-like domain-containing protein [Frondihabitans cladoniiphilus]|uniref:Outer membrane channel protein CpnT-like N-terminal domain-containing protein n=1 Tax=Frondihabitans cladoniiphilus TaxID=715785 RepID=A0ABP8VQW5_9MICO